MPKPVSCCSVTVFFHPDVDDDDDVEPTTDREVDDGAVANDASGAERGVCQPACMALLIADGGVDIGVVIGGGVL